MYPVIVTVAIFGLTNLGALVFAVGGFKARLTNLEVWKEKAGSEIADTAGRVSRVEGHLGI
jgi:hypothetical protein